MCSLSEQEYRTELMALLTGVLREFEHTYGSTSPYFTPDVWAPFSASTRPSRSLLYGHGHAAATPRSLTMHARELASLEENG
jgi:hypothetical protein